MRAYLLSQKKMQKLLLSCTLVLGLLIHFTAAAQEASDQGSTKPRPVHQKVERSRQSAAFATQASNQVAQKKEVESLDPLAPELLDIASQVFTGRLQCELGQVVVLLPIKEFPGRFQLTLKKQKYLMTPSVTPTGAVKLEDKKAGTFWIQLGNKSMLFSSKLGQRIADECQGPGQQAVAMQEKMSPPPSLLEPLPKVDH
jgi:hypothetical protein